MYKRGYSNFVPAEYTTEFKQHRRKLIDGETARKLYLEEVYHASTPQMHIEHTTETQPTCKRKRKVDDDEVSNQKLFACAENNDINTIRHILETYPDKINTVDSYGWSLLMIACQANSIDVVKELLKYNVDCSIRDKAGNSAQSLVIKNKNVYLANILLNHRKESFIESVNVHTKSNETYHKKKSKYTCTICDNRTFDSKDEHLSSTIHNINASKGIKVPTKYAIPETNKGFQLMLKGGWDKESGLGRDGSGTKYPIRSVLKNDKIGLGHKKNKKVKEESEMKSFRKKMLENDKERNRRLEVTFRREFY
ncbi:G patch domain and ankyrin repeat-containing protein 1 homolog [Danaus plexippus]|uniref:G patch domain and ankyrin repeat-containing protein 1 homolog n=1 Tax=Danaus plexippus TaxID=13037 RepID=UPI002AB11411|nr:G patch domain and ankyrin repeat-containing protein 1 homolog [Danaus plexippus]